MYFLRKVLHSLLSFFLIINLIAGVSAKEISYPIKLKFNPESSDSAYIKSSIDSLELLIIQKQWSKAIEKSFYIEEYAHSNNTSSLLSYLLSLNGLIYQNIGELNYSLISFQASLQIEEQNGNPENQASLLNSIGEVYTDMGYFSNGLKNLYSGLKFTEENNDLYNQSKILLSISRIFVKQDDYNNSLNLLNKAESIAKDENIPSLMPKIHKIRGAIHVQEGRFNEAHSEYYKSLKGYRKLNDSLGIANTFYCIGSLLCKQDRFKESLHYHQQSINYKEKYGYLKDLAISFHGISETYLKCDNIDSALHFATKSIDLAQRFNMLYLQNQTANILSTIYEKKGDYKIALYWLNKRNIIHDNIFSINNTRMIVQFENSFEFEKLIEKQRIEQEKKDLQMVEQTKRNMLVRRYLALSTILTFFVMLASLYGYNQKRKHGNLLKEQNEEIRAQNEEIEVQRENLFQLNEELVQKNEVISRNLEEIEKHRNSLANLAWELQERADLIQRQRDALFNQKKEITDSIIYAERIQRALLLPNDNIKKIFSDGFVFHKPKNIISGDFYWISEIRGFKLFAVADCTGHGVPGGIMSMLGMAYLNDILNKEHITKSSDVLEEMRSRIIQSLRQNKNGNGNGNEAESYDGMDMAMCALNTNTMELQYAGAYLPIYIFRKNEVKKAEPIVVKEDRMPVSQYIKTDPFSNHCIKVEPGDMVYLFSDGYSDQFSSDGNKFNISRFKSLLSSIYHLDGNQQHEIISKTFEEWKGDHFQVDDVLVMGLRI